jgi:hypothetical protein
VAPSWFDRLNQPAAATVVAPIPPTGKDPAKAESEKAEPQKAAGPSNAADADIDDDWPTRYSWLEDDETDEAAEASHPADVAETVPAEATAAEPAADEAASTAADEAASTAAPASPAAESPDADAEVHLATANDVATVDPAGETAEPDQTLAVDAAHADQDEHEPSAPRSADSKLVTVIPGVP